MLLDFTVSIDGLTANPTYGDSAETGALLTAIATGFSGAFPGSISYQWATLESGPILGATVADFTPYAATYDGDTIYCTISPVGYPDKVTAGYVIRQAPPVAVNAICDEVVDLGSGDEIYDVAGSFSGAALTFSVTGPGTSINPATGCLTIQTDSPVSGATVIVTASNSGGTAQLAFTLTVENEGAGPGPSLSQPVLNDEANTIDLNVDVNCTIYWRRDVTGTNPTATAVMTGGGLDAGSFEVSQGINAVNIIFASGNDGVQEISFVAAATPAEPSLVQTVAIEIDATELVLYSAFPLEGAGGVAADVTPVLNFSKPIKAGAGAITLYCVTSAVAHEVFDVITNTGSLAGQVEIVGNSLKIRPSAELPSGLDYAVLIDPGALRDAAGNPFPGISSTSELSFSVCSGVVVDTDFGATFASDEAALWTSIQANSFNVTPEHRGMETWSAYPATLTEGGIVGVKSGNYPQLRFSVPVEVGKTYTIDADFPIGEAGWSGTLRVKLGSAINLNDYAQIDETKIGQPLVSKLRGQIITAVTPELWLAVIVETESTGANGGNPALSMLRVEEL